MTAAWFWRQGHFIVQELPLAEGIKPNSLQRRKAMPCSSRNIKQPAACHYMALEFVLWPKADTSAGTKLFLQKMQAQRYDYPRPTRTQNHTKPIETSKFRKIHVQQVSIHKEKGQTQRLSVSGIYRYGRNIEDADTHSSMQCQYEYKSIHCLSLINDKRYVRFPSNTTSLHPKLCKKNQRM